jgi:hypothetical protein
VWIPEDNNSYKCYRNLIGHKQEIKTIRYLKPNDDLKEGVVVTGSLDGNFIFIKQELLNYG